MKTQLEFADNYIFVWEDGKSTDPNKTHSMVKADAGNWSSGIAGQGLLIGSNHGVTPKTLAGFRGVPVLQITWAVMRALTRAEAAQIALKNFYHDVNLDRLAWNAVSASIMDFGWGSGYNRQGQYRATVYAQAMIGAAVDGKIGVGGETVTKFASYVEAFTEAGAAKIWATVRLGYYEEVIKANPAMAYARGGWTNRTNYYTPDDHEGWWDWFHA